jgi:hypothetical protein
VSNFPGLAAFGEMGIGDCKASIGYVALSSLIMGVEGKVNAVL